MDTQRIPKPLLRIFEQAYAENWVLFGGGKHQDFYFLPRTIKTTARGTQTVWAVAVQDADSANWFSSRVAIIEARRLQNSTRGGYDKYLLTKLQWEIDCAGQRNAILQIIDYDEEGNVLLSGNTSSKLEDVVPDSNGEGLLRAFCSPRNRTTFRDLVNTPMGMPVARAKP